MLCGRRRSGLPYWMRYTRGMAISTSNSLFNFMKDKNYRVSRATLYNTIDLLIDCKLVVKA
ncbi:MAG: hypothetical protein MZV63_61645 [Marinilabiliales bacterium]|nr:hypothetical protein [Marinilabiliales bacterium]